MTELEEAGTVTKVDCTWVPVNSGAVETIGSSPVEVETADETVSCSSTEVEATEVTGCPSTEVVAEVTC